MFNIRTIVLAFKSLMLHKLRSGLTILGIVFGVFSVIAMLAIGEGASAQAQQQVLQLGATNIIARSVKPPEENNSGQASTQLVLEYGLYRSDFDLLLNTIPTVANAIPIRETSQEARYLHRVLNVRLVGCTADYQEINHLDMLFGRFLSDSDNEQMSNVVVLGSEVAEKLFPYEQPIGKSIRVGTLQLTVVGVTQHRTSSAAIGGSLSGQDFNKDCYIPIRTFYSRIGDTVIRFANGGLNGEKVELNQITLQITDREDVIPTAEVVRESLQRTHAVKQDFDVIVPLELLRQADQIRQIFNIVLGSIAAISLLVGGIGIMNIMLATVTERTREIGIRRALGAKQKDIISQFLTETIVLSGTGGLIGVGLGLMTPVAFAAIRLIITNFVFSGGDDNSQVAQMFVDMKPQIAWWSLPVAFSISVGIGVVFGIYPARSAARMDPIEALRHE